MQLWRNQEGTGACFFRSGRVLEASVRSAQTDETQDALNSPVTPPDRLGDAVGPGKPQDADGQIAEARHHPRAVALADLASILIESDVAHPVEAIFDRPVPPHKGQELLCGLRSGPGRLVSP